MQSLELPNPFRSRSRSSSDASTANLSLSSQNNPQPSLDFTRRVEEIRREHTGRDGNNQLKSYVPEDELRAYWTDTRIRELGLAYAPHLTIKHEVVNQRCLRLFSALVYTNRVQFFDTLQSKISDEQLPLVQDNLLQSLRSPVFKEVLEDLYEHQWIFCPMILDYARLTDLELQPDHILPFQHIQEITQGDAAHIFKVKVDKSCNRLHPRDKIRGTPLRGEAPSDGIYVLKSYHGERYRRLFLNEAKALTTLHQKSGNEHIVGYYGSFIQNDKFNLLLQFANAGSLLDYYHDPQIGPPTSQQDIRQFWRSLLSVLKGLHQVHQIKPKNDEPGEYRGIHEDIKPDNILLIKGGTSKSAYDFTPLLTDFGHSHFRVAKELEEEEDDMGVDRQGNQTYGAPEASKHADYLLRLPNQIPTAADIWSMGCVISDAAAWLVFGPKGRDEYRKLREEFGSQVENFEDPGHYDCFHDAVGRSQAVDKMHTRIREACHPQDTITPQLLNLVQDHMLLWDWKQRLPANSVFERCRKILSASEGKKTLKDMANKVQTNAQNAAKRISESSMFREKEEQVQDEPSPSLETTTSEPSPSRIAPELKDDPVISQRPAAASRSRPKLTPFRWTSKGKDKETSTQSGGTLDEIVTDTSTSQDLEKRPDQSPPPIEVFRSPRVPPRPAPNPRSHSDGGALSPLSDNTELAFDISRPSSPAHASSAPPVPSVDELAKLDLSLEEATKWRNDWKSWGQLHPEQHRIIKDLQFTLKGRDHIFFIDDSRTMKPHSSEVETALETLAYIVKPQDGKDSSGSVSVAIGSASTTSGNRPTMLHTNSSQTSRLVDIVREKCTYERIETVIEDVFSDLIDKEIIPRLPSESHPRDALAETTRRSSGNAPNLQRSASSASKRRSGSHSTSNANPISVIVLTNGQWGDGKAGAGIDSAIRRLTHQLKERELKRTQVMIQFIRFGNDEIGIRHLDYLDRLGREDTDEYRGYSIVDTQPVTGNLCSMLIGSIRSKL